MWWCGSSAGPMWCWWVLPIVALVCLGLIVAILRAVSGRRFMCMGPHAPGPDGTSELRREVRELRDEMNRMKAVP